MGLLCLKLKKCLDLRYVLALKEFIHTGANAERITKYWTQLQFSLMSHSAVGGGRFFPLCLKFEL